MSLFDLQKRHLRLLGWETVRTALRSGSGIVFVFFTVIFGLVVAQMVIWPIEYAEDIVAERAPAGRAASRRAEPALSREAIHDELRDLIRPLVLRGLGGKEEADSPAAARRQEAAERWTDFLIQERPALLSAILAIMLYGMPFVLVSAAFNLYTGDIQHHGLRYLLLRTERANIYFGRYVGMVVFCLLTMAILITTVVLYVGLKLKLYSWGALLGWSAQGFLGLALTTLPFVALCAAVSGALDSPFASLTISSLLVAGLPIGALIAEAYYPGIGALMHYLLPFWALMRFLHPETGQVLVATQATLAYSVVFLLLGYWNFARRDL